jgi:peptidoglycan/LPS O-acetylase OafA/YrhL
MEMNSRSPAFRPDIEGLRGIAVLMVVAYHCGIRVFSGGFIGVDVFFVLSGYLITALLVAEVEKTSRLSLLEFYARRARRLLPASALVLLVTLLVSTVILAPNEIAFAGRAGRATALYMSNIFFALNAANYFAPDVDTNPLLHTWTLAVEEQFYLFWPLLIMLGMQFLKSKKTLFVGLLGLIVLSLAACVWFTANGGVFAFYGLPARAWEFGIAGLAVLIPRGTIKLPLAGWFAVGWLGIATILASGYLVSSDIGFPGFIALAPVLGTVGVLVAGAELPYRGAGLLLGSAPLQFLGRLSYSWYLWHWPFLVLSAALLPNISVVGKTAVAAISLVIAAVTHRLVENPIRFYPYLVQRPALSLYLAAALTLCSFSAATLSIRAATRLANAPEMKSITAAVNDTPRLPTQECVSLTQSAEVRKCEYGNMASRINLVLFGDSHAEQWFNPLQLIVQSQHWRLTTFVKSGCPAADISPPDTIQFRANCAIWRAEAIRQIVAMRPSLVLVGSATTNLGRRDRPAGRLDVSVDEWRDGTRRTLASLAAAGLPVLAVRDTPIFLFDVPACLARAIRHSWYPDRSCAIDESTSLNSGAFEAEKASVRGLPSVRLLDVTNEFCQDNICPAVQRGMIVYRDNNHITGRFAESLSPILEGEIFSILQIPR